jgi:hypothetical protein
MEQSQFGIFGVECWEVEVDPVLSKGSGVHDAEEEEEEENEEEEEEV